LAGALISTSAMAQVTPVPVQIAPTREEIERGEVPRTTPEGPRVTVEADIERAPCPLADPAYGNITVTLRDVSFANLGPVPASSLRPAYEPFLGRESPIAVVCEIRDAAATILRREGYLAAVQVPTQRIEDGAVRFEVLMARVSAIRVRGDAGKAERLLAGYLENLTEQPVFNRYEAERYMLLARDLPGYDVRLALRPAGTAPGELVGDVIVTRRPYDVSFNLQNLGSKEVGRWGGQLSAQFYGLTGLGDRTSLSVFSTADFEEQQVVQLGHDFRVGPEGLIISGGLTYAWTRPEIDGDTPDTNANTFVANAELIYPIRRTQTSNVRGAIGFDYIDQDVRFGGIDLSQDHIRVAYLRIDGDAIDSGPLGSRGLGPLVQPGWRLAGSLEARRGLDIFDASDGCEGTPSPCAAPGAVPPSRPEGDATGTVFRATGLAEVQLTPAISFALLPRAQYSPNKLLSFEEFSGGNYTVGRGYDPGVIIGDSGVGVQLELRGNIRRQLAPRLAMQPYAFVDSARVWNEDDAFDGLDRQKLTSVGAGVRASYDNRFRLDVALAVPTERAGFQTERPDPRLLISFTTRLLPW
jgi:hemolysin activation/secretion protein